MINIDCQCGEKYFADDQHIGRRIKCQKCGRILPIGVSESLETPQPAINQNRGPQAGRRFSMPIASPAGLSGWQLAGAIGLSVIVILGLIIGLSKFDRHTSTQSTPVPNIVQENSTQSRNPVTPSLKNDSPSAPTVNRYEQPQRRPKVTTPRSPRQPKPRERLHTEDNLEDEPSNPNVLPLGSAPFDYDIREGNSTLAVDNGTSTDALVRVIRVSYSSEKIRNFFIPAGQKYTAQQIPPGTYVLRVAFGKDWNESTRKFNYRQSFSQTQRFDITETRWNEPVVDGYIEHTEASDMSITLHKVPFGNFKSHPISEEEFWR